MSPEPRDRTRPDPFGPTLPVPRGPALALIRRARLVVIDGPDRGLEFPLEAPLVRVGKTPENDLVLTDLTISRSHFSLEDRADDGYLLKDLGSKNGIWIEGRRVHEIFLTRETSFEVGQTTMAFRMEEESLSPDPAATPEPEDGAGLVAASPTMREFVGLLGRVARTELSVLLLGETGTGKEVLARAIHEKSPRREAPWVVFDCAATDPGLMGASLFGHKEGAFTGSAGARKGAFLGAHGGTLFIDELGDLPLELQPKLLRVLQERMVLPLGSDTPVKADVRIVAATHRDLKKLVSEGRFRQDLYYRLSGIVMKVPSLRERREDIAALAHRFLTAMRAGTKLSPASREKLMRHTWPGNVRELKNVVDRAAALTEGQVILPEDLVIDEAEGMPAPPGTAPLASPQSEPATASAAPGAKPTSLDETEKRAILEALESTGWNKAQAARILGITRKTLRQKIARYGLGPDEED